MLEIRLLGQFDVRLDGKGVAITTRNAQSLLAFLALHLGNAFRREKLAGLLWPERPEAAARSNLAHVLANLRHAIGDHEARPPVLLVGKQPSEQALLARRLIVRKLSLEIAKGVSKLPLRGVGLDRA